MVQDLDVDTLKLLLDYLYLGKGSRKKNPGIYGQADHKRGDISSK